MRDRLICFLLFVLCFSGCSVAPRFYHRRADRNHHRYQIGIASYYADAYHGRQTASGEIFDMNELTAAHRTLPFQTAVRVTNYNNGKSVIVRINDRGPFVYGRIIDLSKAAAERIGMIQDGIVPVKVEVVK